MCLNAKSLNTSKTNVKMYMGKDTGICSKCSLPTELCVCESLDQEDQLITIAIDKRKWGRAMTVITFSEYKEVDMDDLCTKVKKHCASGGTTKGNRIEVQGDHRHKLKKFLKKLGYSEENIEVR